MEEKNKFMVRVYCATYNHAPYIVDTMNGFCMQETNFPFLCTIIDDASNDGEPEVIRNYLQEHFDLENKSIIRNEETDDYVLIFTRHKTNINCYFAVFFLKYNHYRIKKSKNYFQEWTNIKYVATCEGDDFWVNPNKLQMQVDFMEANLGYSMCHGDVIYYNSDTKTSIGRRGKQSDYQKQKPYRTKEEIFNRIIESPLEVSTL